MKKAFTLVELLVVIGIIGVLSAILLVSYSGGTESARNAKCLTNMRNLAAACQSYGMATGHYPAAGSFEKFEIDESRGIHNAKRQYFERSGWLSWNSQGAYASKPQQHTSSDSWFTSCYNQQEEVREYALTNGALWKYVSANRDVFVCPCHKIAYASAKQSSKVSKPLWSYVMNAYFCWDKSKGQRAMDENYWGIEYGKLKRADKRLLFAEIPFTNWISDPPEVSDNGMENDCTLQYAVRDGGEYIGFNHKSGKRNKFAHIVFADSHVEKISLPEKSGLGAGEARELTEWLCQGKDVSFNGSRYEKLND